jgi:hypothetical protein
MASLSIIFAAIPAVIYLAAGLPVTAGTVSIGTLIAFSGPTAGQGVSRESPRDAVGTSYRRQAFDP